MGELLEAGRTRVRTIEREIPQLQFDEPVVLNHHHPLTRAPRQVPGRALGGAVLTWLALVYGLCYLALPLLASAVGLHTIFLGNLILNTLAFAPMALLTALLVVAIRPEVVLHPAAPRDPIGAATAGSLLVWFLAHESFGALAPITAMPAGEAAAFVTMNVVESTMIGMMLASFVRTPARAFVLGSAFQIVLVSLFLGWLI